jgi:transposase
MLAELGPDMTVFPFRPPRRRLGGRVAGQQRERRQTAAQHCPQRERPLGHHLGTGRLGRRPAEGTYLKDKYWRLRVRRGAMRALVAIAHKILIAAYHMLRDGKDYVDLGEAYLRQRTAPSKRKLVRELEALGYKVTLEATPT